MLDFHNFLYVIRTVAYFVGKIAEFIQDPGATQFDMIGLYIFGDVTHELGHVLDHFTDAVFESV